jgi:hypothetical protein
MSIDDRVPDIINVKYLNNKCRVLAKQIEELKYNYQEMLMSRNNKEYTFIDGGKLVHIQPYASKDVENTNMCKAICSKQQDCYGFNSYDNISLFNKQPTTCDFISPGRYTTTTGSITKEDGGNSLHIKINDENLRTTKKILDRLISEFQATCNRNMSLIERMEGFTSATRDQTSNQIIYVGSTLDTLRRELLGHYDYVTDLLNDTQYIQKDNNNTHLHVTHNNIMLSIYTIVIVILIIIIFKIILGI